MTSPASQKDCWFFLWTAGGRPSLRWNFCGRTSMNYLVVDMFFIDRRWDKPNQQIFMNRNVSNVILLIVRCSHAITDIRGLSADAARKSLYRLHKAIANAMLRRAQRSRSDSLSCINSIVINVVHVFQWVENCVGKWVTVVIELNI